jgi:Domain of unknown function (DUF4386)
MALITRGDIPMTGRAATPSLMVRTNRAGTVATGRRTNTSPLVAARFAGLLYLLIAIVSPFSFFYVRSSIVVPGDATATASHLMASEWLFRMGIVGDSLVFLSEIVLVALLYRLFKPVSPTLALATVFARLAMAVLQGVNLLNYFVVLLLLSGADYLTVFEPAQLHALALLFLTAYADVALIWGTFFGLHLVGLGVLVYKSGYFPRLLGVLLVAAAVGYLTDSFGNFLLPQYDAIYAQIVVVLALAGELLFTLWLLIRGVNVATWEQRVRESA